MRDAIPLLFGQCAMDFPSAARPLEQLHVRAAGGRRRHGGGATKGDSGAATFRRPYPRLGRGTAAAEKSAAKNVVPAIRMSRSTLCFAASGHHSLPCRHSHGPFFSCF